MLEQAMYREVEKRVTLSLMAQHVEVDHEQIKRLAEREMERIAKKLVDQFYRR